MRYLDAQTAARWVARAPLSEQAYRRLMAAQVLNGQRPAALQTYQQLQATLQHELGLEPSRETAVLTDHISRGRVDEDRRGSVDMMDASPTGIHSGRRVNLPMG